MGRPATSIPHKEVICYCFFYLVFSFWANIQCKNLLVSTYASETRDFQFESAYLVFFKWANPGLFLFIFVLFNNNLQKNCRLQRESNSDRWSRRRARWPLYHHHGHSIFCLNQLGFRQMTEYAKGGGELSAFKSMKQKIKQTDQTDIFQSMKFCFYFPTVCYSCHGILTYILDCAVYTLQLCCR